MSRRKYIPANVSTNNRTVKTVTLDLTEEVKHYPRLPTFASLQQSNHSHQFRFCDLLGAAESSP